MKPISDLQRVRRTIYLYPDVDRAVRHHVVDTDEEISEVVNAALRQFFGLPEKQ